MTVPEANMSAKAGRPLWLTLGLAALYLGLAAVIGNPYILLIMTLVPIWATVGVSWNVFSGYSGLLSFGHAAFFGLGAYTVAIAFALGAAVTGIAGGLIASYYPFQPYVGVEFVVIMYAGVVLGGMGSIKGAFWGGLIIGLVQQMSTLVLPVQLQNSAIFVVFLLVMLLRPQGLFGKSIDRA